MESCSACPAGHYCSSEGLAAPSGPCSAGFYCPFDFSSTTPYAFLCPKVCLFMYTSVYASSFSSFMSLDLNMLHMLHRLLLMPCQIGCVSLDVPLIVFLLFQGHFCPEGSALALPCPTGEYQPNPGSENCVPCRPGFFCEEAVVGDPWPCPPHSFCPAGAIWKVLFPTGGM